MMRTELRMGLMKRGPPLIQMWRRRRNWREDSQLYSCTETFVENSFISGVWTKMHTPLIPTTKVPRTMEGYLRKSGLDKKQSIRAPAVKVNTVSYTHLTLPTKA